MIGTPIHTRRWATVCLIATLVLGMFMVALPMSASAAFSSKAEDMNGMPMGDNTGAGCFQQGCLVQHTSCNKHCVLPSNEYTAAGSPATFHQDQPLTNESLEYFTIEFPDQTPSLVGTPDRAPPIHQFLRSVIKRE